MASWMLKSVLASVLALCLCAEVIQVPIRSLVKKNKGLQSLSQGNGARLDFSEANQKFVGVVSVGTPLQDFLVNFDFNSGAFWVPDSKCNCGAECKQEDVCVSVCSAHCCGRNPPTTTTTQKPDIPDGPNEFLNFARKPANATGTCGKKNAFDVSASKSVVKTSKTATEEFLKDVVETSITYDNFRLGPHYRPGLSANAIQFGLVKEFPAGYDEEEYDGVFGLAPGNKQSGIRSPVEQLIQRNAIQNSLATVYISPTIGNYTEIDGVVTLGALDNVRCDVSNVTFQNTASKTNWEFRVHTTNVSSYDFADSSWKGRLDLSTSFYTVPNVVYSKMLAQFSGATKDPLTGYDIVPCRTSFRWLITIGQLSIYHYSTTHVLAPYDLNRCILKVKPSKSSDPVQWTFGTTFLKDYCTMLDYQGRIGFANVLSNS